MIEPNNSKATLGTMLGHMRSHPNDFCPLLPAPGIAPSAVIGMMTALCEGQTSRHGGQQPTRPETSQEAYAAVHLAVVLVRWFRSGTVRRTREGQNGGSSERPRPHRHPMPTGRAPRPGTPAYTSCFSLALDLVLSAENPIRIRSPEDQWHPRCASAARRRLVDATRTRRYKQRLGMYSGRRGKWRIK